MAFPYPKSGHRVEENPAVPQADIRGSAFASIAGDPCFFGLSAREPRNGACSVFLESSCSRGTGRRWTRSSVLHGTSEGQRTKRPDRNHSFGYSKFGIDARERMLEIFIDAHQ